MKIAGLFCAALLVACGTETPEDPALSFDEPELTAPELAMLPDGLHPDPDHTDAQLVSGPQEDDAATFDDDAAELLYDEDVPDDGTALMRDDAVAGSVAAKPLAFKPLLHSGLHPRASDALRAAGVTASRIIQTIGDAPASAGYHLADGTVGGLAYTAAVDLSVKNLSATQIRNLLERLGKVGYAGWYRENGHDGWVGANHIHAVYANCLMKPQLQAQVRSWLLNRNGLVSNTTYRFHTFSKLAKRVVKGKFELSKHGTTNKGGGVCGRVNTSGAPVKIRATPSPKANEVGTIADGLFFTITCQKRGSSVTGTYGTSTLWDHTGGGYVADANVSTGSDGQVAPTCK